MSTNNLLTKYIWIVDTIRRVGRITRSDLSDRWEDSPVSEGRPLARRTFYNYREAIYDLLGLEIKFDSSTNEYYIDQSETDSGSPAGSESLTNWLLNSAAISGVISDSREIANRIFLEEVPSARQHLGAFIDAIKSSSQIQFAYQPFSRTTVTSGIIFEPYLLKLFRQRWYVAGYNVAEGRIKTYALDRVSDVAILKSHFDPAHRAFNPDTYFANSFGIVVDQSAPRDVAIRTDSRQAKYLRALPLHHSQREMVHDDFSIFYYHIQLTQDFLNELLSMGSRITVVSPPELRTMLTAALRDTLSLYE